ncbi:unnamed protein product [Gordionus sp. m RMFG-2023]
MRSKIFYQYFEIEFIINWINQNGYKRVALQFPDEYLKYSLDISNLIKAKSECQTYVLADTSYGNCCVDLIASQHANCDSLIHFGPACLFSGTINDNITNFKNGFPVYYCFAHLDSSEKYNVTDFINSIFYEPLNKKDSNANEQEQILTSVASIFNEYQKLHMTDSNLKIQILLFYEFSYFRNIIKNLDAMEIILQEKFTDMLLRLNKNNSSINSEDKKITLDFIISAPDFPPNSYCSENMSETNHNYFSNNNNENKFIRECSRIYLSSKSIQNISPHNANKLVRTKIVKNGILNFVIPPEICSSYSFNEDQVKDNENNEKSPNSFDFEEKICQSFLIFVGHQECPAFTRIFFRYFPKIYASKNGLSGGEINTSSVRRFDKVDSFFIYDPNYQKSLDCLMLRDDFSMNRMISRRYFYIEKGRQAKIVGIIIGTLADSRIIEAIQRFFFF